MYRIKTLVLSFLVILSQLGSVQPSAAQSVFELKHYREATQKRIQAPSLSSAYWAEAYQQNLKRYQALQLDVHEIFKSYLQNTALPEPKTIELLFEKDRFLKDKFETASSSALVEASLDLLAQVSTSKLASVIRNARTNHQLFPLHFRIYDDESTEVLSAYYERGTHKVKMSLDRIDPKNWLTWFVHEHLHFLDPILNEAETSLSDQTVTDQIDGWIQSNHTDLTPAEKEVLTRYFTRLTNISIQAEWRDWVATSIFAQNALLKGSMKEVPPCLSFLTSAGFGQRSLPLKELKELWWAKLKEGFYVESAGLFKSGWLKQQLLDYVNSLQVEDLRSEGLLPLVN